MHPTLTDLAPLRTALRAISPFTDAELDYFTDGLHLRTYGRKELILSEGKVCKEIGFLLSGSIRYYYTKDGLEITNYFSLEGEWMGSYRSFLIQQPGRVNLESLEDGTRVAYLHYDQLRAWERDPARAARIIDFCRRLAEFNIGCFEDRVASFVLDSPEERYLKLRTECPDVFQRIPQQYIANYLGITPVSLSRIRKRLLD